MPSTSYSSLSTAGLIARLQAVERQELAALNELRDVKAALDGRSIVAITDTLLAEAIRRPGLFVSLLLVPSMSTP